MKRLPEIDGLRGIAILLVVSFHYINNQLVDSTNRVGQVFAKLTGFGWVGVDLFFVLSGFLIGTILLTNRQSPNYFTTFYVRRLVRIVPNYYLLLVIFIIIFYSGFFDSNDFLTDKAQNATSIIPLWSYFLMIHNFFMAGIKDLGIDSIDVTWSIGIEEQFYIIFPLLLYKLNNKLVPWLLGLVIIIAILSRLHYPIPPGNNWIPRYVLLNCRADSLALGIFVAWFRLNYNLEEFIKKNIYFLSGFLFMMIAACGFFCAMYGDLGTLKHTLFSVIFGIAVILALGYNKNLYGSFLRNKHLRWVGSISYSLYLFHYLILGLAHSISGKRGVIINNLNDVLISLGALIVSFGFSYFVYKYVESPMIKIGKRFTY